MNFNFKNLFNSFKFNFIREQMNLFSLKIAMRIILEWDGMYWHMEREAKTCFAEVLIGNKLKTRISSKHYFKLDLILNKIICKQLKWENTLCRLIWAVINIKINHIKIFRLTQIKCNLSFSIKTILRISLYQSLIVNKQ